MKKSISLLLSAFIVLSCFAFAGCGEKEKPEEAPAGLEFTKVSETEEIRTSKDDGYVCTIKEDAPESLTIPAKFRGKDVVALTGGSDAAELTSLDVGDGIEVIQDCCNGSAALKELTLPGSLKEIKKSFTGCAALGELHFSGGGCALSTAIYSSSFGNSPIGSFVFDDKVTEVSAVTDTVFPALKSIEFKSGVEKIGENLLCACKTLKTLTFSGDVGTIGEDAFYKCEALDNLQFNGNVNEIAEGAFKECNALKSLEFKMKVGTFGQLSFANCSALETVMFDKDVGVIDGFSFCDELSSVSFGGKVTELKSWAFSGCDKLRKVTLPEGTVNNSSIHTVEFDQFLETLKTDEMIQAAKKVLGTKLDSGKQIEPEQATNYANMLNGAIIGTDICADCKYEDYSADHVPADVTLEVEDIETISVDYPDTIYSDQKKKAVIDGSAPIVYCLVERMGYDGPYKFHHSSNKSWTEDIYVLYNRISLWNKNTGELVAWYTQRTAAVPTSMSVDGGTHISCGSKDDSRRFVYSANNTATYAVLDSIYGK